jgi:hypothetical protein
MKLKAHSYLPLLKFILFSGLMFFTSCAYYDCDPTYKGPKNRDANMLEYYSYPKHEIEAKIEKIYESNKYIIERIEFQSSLNFFGTDNNIKIDYYVQKKEGKFPVVLVMPLSSHIDFAAKGFARKFVSNGINCAILHDRDFDLEDARSAEEVENYFSQTVLDAKQTLDYLVERREVDKDKLGCMGFSLGGIKASLISGVDERIKYSVIGLAGGSIADITVKSKYKGMRDYIQEMWKLGIDSEIIYDELSSKVITDPLELGGYIDARNILMYIASFDQVIPRQSCEKLRQTIGVPETVYFFTGHYGSFLYLPYAEGKSLSFFKQKFGLK